MDLTIPKCYTSTGSQIAEYNYRFCDDYLERKFTDVICIRIQISNIAVDSLTKPRLGCPDEKQHVSDGINQKAIVAKPVSTLSNLTTDLAARPNPPYRVSMARSAVVDGRDRYVCHPPYLHTLRFQAVQLSVDQVYVVAVVLIPLTRLYKCPLAQFLCRQEQQCLRLLMLPF